MIESIGYSATIIDVANKSSLSKKELVLAIEGMTCTSCSSTIENLLSGMEGVISASILASTGSGVVVIDETLVPVEKIQSSIDDIGFLCTLVSVNDVRDGDGDPSGEKESSQYILSVTAASSLSLVEVHSIATFVETLRTYDGIIDVNVVSKSGLPLDLTSIHPSKEFLIKMSCFDSFPLRLSAKLASDNGIVAQISSMGGFMMANNLGDQYEKESRRHRNDLIAALAFTIPILLITMVFPYFPRLEEGMMIILVPGFDIYTLMLLILSFPVQWIIGFQFHWKAWKSVWNQSTLGMDFLISTGTCGAYVFSLIGVIQGLVLKKTRDMYVEYFETSAVLIAVVLLGKYLETYAKGRTASAIHKLSSLRPKSARLVVDHTLYQAARSQGHFISENSACLNNLPSFLLMDRGENQDPFFKKGKDEESDELELGEAVASDYVEISSSWVQHGDCLRLVVGETVPSDGILVSGFCGIDESMLTGESIVVNKMVGDKVYGGTTVVEGSAVVMVTACGDHSTLGKIVSTVQSAQSSKPPIQEFADIVARKFVPAVASVSIITFLVWIVAYYTGAVPSDWLMGSNPVLFAFLFALSVWVSACPCAFGLATPTAILVSTGIGAKNGILIRRGASIQFASEVDTIAFDKTGTLTCGKPEVADFFLVDTVGSVTRLPSDSHKVLKSISTPGEVNPSISCNLGVVDIGIILHSLLKAESKSSHPLARGISEFCKDQLNILSDYSSFPITNLMDSNTEGVFDVVPGQGIQVTQAIANPTNLPNTLNSRFLTKWSTGSEINDTISILVGSANLLASRGIVLSEPAETVAMGFREGGKVTIFIAIDGIVAGVMGVADKIRPETYAVIQDLHYHGIKCYMVTGDEKHTAHAIGAAIGISKDCIFARAKPDDKEKFISALQNKGRKVMFIGDGTNDSPALARANVGAAMAGGTDIAIESGDVVFCKNSLESLIIFLELSKQCMRRILFNYFWALFYNIILIPVAAGIFYPSFRFALAPMMAGSAMAASSVSIVVSSLMLGLFKPPQIFTYVDKHDSMNHQASDVPNCECPASYSPLVLREKSILDRVRELWRGGYSHPENDGIDHEESSIPLISSPNDDLSVYKVMTSYDSNFETLLESPSESSKLRRRGKKESSSTVDKCSCKTVNCKCGGACMCGVVSITK